MIKKRFLGLPLVSVLLFTMTFFCINDHIAYGQLPQPTGTQPQPGFSPRPQPTGTQPQPGFSPRPQPTGTQPQPGFSPRPQPTGTQPQPGFSPRPQPTGTQPQPGFSPRPQPTGTQPQPGFSPRPQPTGTQPQPEPTPGVVTPQISGGWSHTLALDSEGKLWAWGYNEDGQLGDGTNDNQTTPVAVQINALTTITSVDCGGDHSLALDSLGRVWAWGYNGDGELGGGTTENNSNVPVSVPNLTDIIAISAGGEYSMALSSDGSVLTWGANSDGQLGNGNTDENSVPTKISGLPVMKGISAGEAHGLAVTEDGFVYAWGINDEGQIGNGEKSANNPVLNPVQVQGLTDIDAVCAGTSFSLALGIDGRVWAWGLNDEGQLGDGTNTNSTTPVEVTNLTKISAVACGSDHSLAIRNGKVKSWGLNDEGQLGDGSTRSSSAPLDVTGLSDIVYVAAGESHSLAITSKGNIYVWGLNGDGQLGDGTNRSSRTPKTIDLNLGGTAVEGPGECETDDIEADPKKLKLKVGKNTEVTLTLTGEDGCLVEGESITVKLNSSGKRRVSISPSKLISDEEGKASFTATGTAKGKAKITVKAGSSKEKIKVKVKE
ncbi:cell wall anchor protein [Candidatus Kuenenia sp.]|uniref:RCC1 domain-containing protein n=1 Tax=Candidatus Kuenenia sp. TaxID=2499824 RepID=UPI00321F786A